MAALWREAGLSWKDFLPEEEDVHAFLMEQVSWEPEQGHSDLLVTLFTSDRGRRFD